MFTGFLFCVMATMAVLKYQSLHSAYTDLGIFLNHFFVIGQGEYWRMFYGHVQPLMLPWSWFYNGLPPEITANSILVLQAGMLSLPALWLYRQYGRMAALAYALFFPLWYNALFDFHMDHMAVVLLSGFFIALKRNYIKIAVSAAILLALVKEPFALQTATCGVVLLLETRKRLTALFLIVFGLAWFFLSIQFLIPLYAGETNDAMGIASYKWLGDTVMDKIVYICTNPQAIVMDIINTPKKALYLTYLLGSLGGISLLSPIYLIPAVPILAMSLLSNVDNHYGIAHHYTAGLIAPLVFGFAEGLPRARRLWKRIKLPAAAFGCIIVLWMLGCHILFSPSPLGRLFWLPKVWSYQRSAYSPTTRDAMIKDALGKFIPADPTIAVSSHTTVNWHHLANRQFYFAFPLAVTEAFDVPVVHKQVLADYVVLDLKRPWFIGDKGCEWLYGECRNPEITDQFRTLVVAAKKSHEVVFEKDGFLILKKE